MIFPNRYVKTDQSRVSKLFVLSCSLRDKKWKGKQRRINSFSKKTVKEDFSTGIYKYEEECFFVHISNVAFWRDEVKYLLLVNRSGSKIWVLCKRLHWQMQANKQLDHEITLKILEFVLNLTEKVKHGFLLSSMCIFSELNETKS